MSTLDQIQSKLDDAQEFIIPGLARERKEAKTQPERDAVDYQIQDIVAWVQSVRHQFEEMIDAGKGKHDQIEHMTAMCAQIRLMERSCFQIMGMLR